VGVYHTGHPLTVLIGRDPTVIPDGNDRSDQRPDFIPGTPLVTGNPNNWINESYDALGNPLGPFVPPAAGTFGNAGRGLLRAPNIWQIDFSLEKSTKLTEKVSMQFRVEAFNIFNHVQFGDPGQLDILAGPGSFGVISSTVGFNNHNDNFFAPNTGSGLPRQIEFMLRLNF
jgi:hypothetical protein